LISSLWKRLVCALDLGGLSPRELAARTLKGVSKHESTTRAAAIAYYAFSALVPFLGVVFTLVIALLPVAARAGISQSARLMEELNRLPATVLPPEAAQVVTGQLERIQNRPPVGLLSFGLLVSLYLASGIFLTVMDALNKQYGVEESRPFWKRTLTALGMTLIEATILLGALLTFVLWPQLVGWLRLGGSGETVAAIVSTAIVFVAVLMSFALVFTVGPSESDSRWEWLTPGSLLGTLAFMGATAGFRLYVQKFAAYDQTYGSLGGVLVLLLWLWLTGLILLVAAQVNRTIKEACKESAERGRSQGARPDAHALYRSTPRKARS
jgi:membrane protein